MNSFNVNGATVTLGSPTAKSRMKLNFLLRYAREIELQDEYGGYIARECAWLLYAVESVDGDAGFVIPHERPSSESFAQFIEGFGNLDETVFDAWLAAHNTLRTATQADSDLLPADDLTDDQKKINPPKKND